MHISDDFEAASVAGKTPAATASIFLLGDPDQVSVTLNGHVLEANASVNQRA